MPTPAKAPSTTDHRPSLLPAGASTQVWHPSCLSYPLRQGPERLSAACDHPHLFSHTQEIVHLAPGQR
jgi:hypothetical protein